MEGEIVPTSDANDELEKRMTESLTHGYSPKVARLEMSVLGSAIPILGGAVSGAGAGVVLAGKPLLGRRGD